MNKQEFVSAVERYIDMPRADIERIIEVMPKVIEDGLVEDGEVKIKGLFHFEVYTRKSRMVFIPAKGKTVKCKEHPHVRCRLGKPILDAVLNY